MVETASYKKRPEESSKEQYLDFMGREIEDTPQIERKRTVSSESKPAANYTFGTF